MKKVNIRPIGDRVLVEPSEVADQTKGGIIIPDMAKEKPIEGKIVAVGNGRRNEEGDRVPIDLKVGDIVLLPKYGGIEVDMNGSKCQIVREDDVAAVVEA